MYTYIYVAIVFMYKDLAHAIDRVITTRDQASRIAIVDVMIKLMQNASKNKNPKYASRGRYR